mmetsp:Transcript_86987/g.243876  ORF Transcript_86987/g.243876 Transcript_86987/m.243876 type:complete len:218 (+) Transcript_86987:889-1542(+)
MGKYKKSTWPGKPAESNFSHSKSRVYWLGIFRNIIVVGRFSTFFSAAFAPLFRVFCLGKLSVVSSAVVPSVRSGKAGTAGNSVAQDDSMGQYHAWSQPTCTIDCSFEASTPHELCHSTASNAKETGGGDGRSVPSESLAAVVGVKKAHDGEGVDLSFARTLRRRPRLYVRCLWHSTSATPTFGFATAMTSWAEDGGSDVGVAFFVHAFRATMPFEGC